MSNEDLTNWALLREMSDEEVDARATDDPDAQPTDAAFWQDAKVTLPPGKTRVFLDLDDDVLAWFKSQGRAYGRRMNDALRVFVEQRRGGPQSAGEVAEPDAEYDASGRGRSRAD
ncbi:MAG: hypothetical protein GY719_41275 [bacterium]|nr:hypothetical protein [bacterium]